MAHPGPHDPAPVQLLERPPSDLPVFSQSLWSLALGMSEGPSQCETLHTLNEGSTIADAQNRASLRYFF